MLQASQYTVAKLHCNQNTISYSRQFRQFQNNRDYWATARRITCHKNPQKTFMKSGFRDDSRLKGGRPESPASPTASYSLEHLALSLGACVGRPDVQKRVRQAISSYLWPDLCMLAPGIAQPATQTGPGLCSYISYILLARVPTTVPELLRPACLQAQPGDTPPLNLVGQAVVLSRANHIFWRAAALIRAPHIGSPI